MPITKKVILLIVSLNLLTVLLLYSVLEIFVVRKFAEIEANEMVSNLGRAKNALDERFSPVMVLNKDWANWDDSYNFVDTLNQSFVQTNMVDETFSGTGVDIIVFYRNDGTVIQRKISSSLEDSENAVFQTAVESVKKNVFNEKVLSADEPHSGFYFVEDRLLFISISPILTSEGNGPRHGVLLMGSLVNKSVINQIREITKLSIEVNKNPNNEVLLSNEGVTILPENNEVISGSKIISDFFGENTISLDVRTERSVMREGNNAVKYVMLTTLFISALSILIGILFMDFVLLKPLRKMVKEVDSVKDNKDFSHRLSTKGSSELAALSGNVNKMLETLQKSENKLLSANESMTKKAQELETKSAELEKINQYMVGREIRMAELKQEIADLKVRLEEKQTPNG